ncbi:MAG: DUF512 domain-containing protein [Lachnospiraceae bacterium]|nr:DUF512 domain-containing protein [Lachnospiraceae bacterium]
MNTKRHIIQKVLPGSIAQEMGLEAGDAVLKINGQEIDDIFDYQYLVQDDYIEVAVLAKGGEECILEIEKDFGEDLGLEFENGLMDEYRSCHNKCIFCFIDQMPKGMRDTLYFKDDDSRLSFLQGNYVTLTNMSDHDIDRIIRYRLEPINISFQTTNPGLRCMMLNNRFAGEALKKADRLFEAGIEMNGQIVLCKGINDGAELNRSISDLMRYLPYLTSVSVVPVGLSAFREGLYPLEPFTAEDAKQVIDCIESFQNKVWEEHGIHFVHASDEWYLLADRELPEAERYDGYLQLENGVGMLRLLTDEFEEALQQEMRNMAQNISGQKHACNVQGGENLQSAPERETQTEEISIATGKLAYPSIKRMAGQAEELRPGLRIHVYEITNYFFGEMITVSGLLTGQDIMGQLKGKNLGKRLLLPVNMLRDGTDVFLDDVTVGEVEKTLQVPVDIVKSSGYDLLSCMLRGGGER